MKLSKQRLKKIIREEFIREIGGDPPMNPAEVKERDISHAAENLARQLEKDHGAEAAIKLLAYALDTIQPGLYQPSAGEREEFMQDPGPGTSKGLAGKIDFDLEESYTKKQKAWACAQDDPKFDNMCTDPLKKKKA